MAPGSPLKLTLFRKKKEASTNASDLNYGEAAPVSPSAASDSTKKRWGFFSGKSRRNSADLHGSEEIIRHMQQELDFLRAQTQKQELDLRGLNQELHTRDAENNDLQAQWNLHNFKYQLLVDMWAMRVLDNEELVQHTQPAP
ncbi:hypothetical protein WJX72_012342 [[Myrmecia] bisecta]|uniref:Uncharacterized protein n=1 Tax=[Myrmecia] bisecta TaxID=41462 RepID=A0AAW1QT34_9CHLO